MCMDWNNPNMFMISPSDLQIHKNPYQNSIAILNRNRKKNPKIHMQPHKTPNNKNYFEQEEQSWRHHTF